MIKLNLEGVLRGLGLSEQHGLNAKLATILGVHRNTVRKLRSGSQHTINVASLSALVEWLEEQGVRDPLHQIFQRIDFWTVLAHADTHLVIPEIQFDDSNDSWIAPTDVFIETELRRLAGFYNADVSVHHALNRRSNVRNQTLDRLNQQASRRLYGELISKVDRVCVMVGSPKVNLFVEYFLADLFDATPFGKWQDNAPFFTVPRQDDAPFQSAFTRFGSNHQPGLYVRESSKWVRMPYRRNKHQVLEDSGIVFVRQRSNGQDVAFFGTTGAGTHAIADQIIQRRKMPVTSQMSNQEDIKLFTAHVDFSTSHAECSFAPLVFTPE